MIKISVIIPVFNTEKYLRECLDSVIFQTLKEIEVICINDGSEDGSEYILEEYSRNDNRITIISQENTGTGAVRNKGLQIAKGQFVAFMDSDDYYPENNVLEIIYYSDKK
jgi:glycosyltransferase involved in cell wall biosynthesis